MNNNDQQTQQGQQQGQQDTGQSQGQQGQQSIVTQVKSINPRKPNEVDLSRLSGGEEEEQGGEQQQQAQQQGQQQGQQQQQAQPADLKALLRTHPELAQLAQRAQAADQLQQQLDSVRPYLPDIQRMMQQRQNEARQKGDMTEDFNQVFGSEYGGQVHNLLKAFVANMVPQQLGQFDQRLSSVESMGREGKINTTCDQWFEKLKPAFKSDDEAAEVIHSVIGMLKTRKPNFSADDLNSAIALEVSNRLIQNPGQGAAPTGMPAGGMQQGASIPSTQAAQRMVPSAAEAQRRSDGALENGQQGGQQLDAGDMQQQEADRVLNDYRDW